MDWATTSESFRKIIGRDKVAVQEAEWGGDMAGGSTTAKYKHTVLKMHGVIAPHGEVSAEREGFAERFAKRLGSAMTSANPLAQGSAGISLK